MGKIEELKNQIQVSLSELGTVAYQREFLKAKAMQIAQNINRLDTDLTKLEEAAKEVNAEAKPADATESKPSN
jgi:hypothetical protein